MLSFFLFFIKMFQKFGIINRLFLLKFYTYFRNLLIYYIHKTSFVLQDTPLFFQLTILQQLQHQEVQNLLSAVVNIVFCNFDQLLNHKKRFVCAGNVFNSFSVNVYFVIFGFLMSICIICTFIIPLLMK
jgi:hypothetical protein